MVAHPVTQVIGKQALMDILDLSEVAAPAGVFLHPAVDWAEDGEGIRPAAGTGNEWEEINWLPACVWYHAQVSNGPKVEPVCSTLLGHFPSKSNISWRGL